MPKRQKKKENLFIGGLEIALQEQWNKKSWLKRLWEKLWKSDRK